MRKGKKALLLLTMTACLAFGSEVSAEMTSKGTTGTGAYSTYGTTTNRSGNAGTMSGYGTGTYDTNNYRAYNDNNYRTYATNDNRFRQVIRLKNCRSRCRYALSLNNRRKLAAKFTTVNTAKTGIRSIGVPSYHMPALAAA
jgi:hypothetical protein